MVDLHGAVVVSIFVSLAYLAVGAARTVVAAVRRGGRRDDPADDSRTLSTSRFTVPVSIIVPLGRNAGADAADATIAALLGLNYPEFEVIVVAHGAGDALWASLKRAWDLEAKEFFYRQSLATTAVNKIYRSARDARLMIVDKAPAGRTDAVNCGVNLARFRYICAIDTGIEFDADALLRAMAAPMRDPAAVVAASSHLETRPRDAARNGRGMTLSGALQHLASVRALMDSRLVWRTMDATLCPYDAVVAWRRDAVVQVGGFSTLAADPDLDMMVRLQTAVVPRIDGGVVRSTEIFGRVEPRLLAAHTQLTARRQCATLQTVWACRPRGPAGWRMLAHFVLSEVVTPFVQAWLVAALAVGAVAGWFSWGQVGLLVLLLSFARAMVNGAALLVRGSGADAPDEGTLRQLLLAAPLDFVASGAASVFGRVAGIGAFLKSAWGMGAAS